MQEVSILTIKEIAGLIFNENPAKQKKISDSNVVLFYILCKLLNKLENCIELLIDRI